VLQSSQLAEEKQAAAVDVPDAEAPLDVVPVLRSLVVAELEALGRPHNRIPNHFAFLLVM
jgi:hypothetical protein